MATSKWFWLLLLVAQNTSKTLILRLAVGGKGKFLYSAAVLATEGLKATASCLWVLRSGGSVSSITHFLRSEWRIFVRVMIPAGIYNCQQMLEFVALSRLEAPVFSVIVQTKLLTTALFSWIVLGKRLHRIQLIALVLLMVGVVLAQMSNRKVSVDYESSSGDVTVGVIATLTIATLSGFAAVYTERVLKHATLQQHAQAEALPCESHHDYVPRDRDSRQSLLQSLSHELLRSPLASPASPAARGVCADMQIQMALASLLIIGVFAIACDFRDIVQHGLWKGFDRRAVIAVASSALGGLIVSAVLKYADSVLKGYATATSVILTGILSAAFFGTTLDLHFVLAVVNVCASIALYSNPNAAAAGGQEKAREGSHADLRAANDGGDETDQLVLPPNQRLSPSAKAVKE